MSSLSTFSRKLYSILLYYKELEKTTIECISETVYLLFLFSIIYVDRALQYVDRTRQFDCLLLYACLERIDFHVQMIFITIAEWFDSELLLLQCKIYSPFLVYVTSFYIYLP